MSRSKLSKVLSLVADYERKHRGSGKAPIAVSGIYDLRMRKDGGTTSLPGWEIEGYWPDVYPGATKRGVYLILDEALEVLYVGKASMGSTVGLRLGSYFTYSSGKGSPMKPVHEGGWDPKPRFVVTLTFEDDDKFEAPALEEFLIEKLSGLLNIRGAS